MRKNERIDLVRRFVADWEALPEDRKVGDVYGWVSLRMGCGRVGAAQLIRDALGECPSCRRVLDLAGRCTMAGVPGSGCRAVASV